MKSNHIQIFLSIALSAACITQYSYAQFNALEKWGNAGSTTPPASFDQNGGTIAITGGGEGFYGTSDDGVFLWSTTGTMTTKGDFTATVRHVSTTNPAPEWGRDGIMLRATQSAGALSADDACWMAARKSNGGLIINRRPTAGARTWRATDIGNSAVNYASDNNDQELATGNVLTTPVFLAAGRSGNRLYSGFAMDLGGGVAGRWVEKWSTDAETAVSALQDNAEVVVGLAHQSHPQTILSGENGINTAVFDSWLYSGTFNAGHFGPAASDFTWQIGGTVHGDPATGQVLGSAYVTENGAATGEPVKWTLSVYPRSSFVPKFGLAGSRRNSTAMPSRLLVPTNNFRQGGLGSAAGLTADIYLDPVDRDKGGNANSLEANLALMTTPGITKTTVVIPQVFWSHGKYPQNAQGENIFAKAYDGFGFFIGNEDNYGVEMKGEIFIPGDADRSQPDLPGEFILFKDGNDDFAYLEIDGKPLINDNNWTGATSRDNGGGNVAVLDVSDPKYNEGAWVPFRMIVWERSGGDSAALYWSVGDGKNGVSPVFTPESVPGTFEASSAALQATGTAQVGSDTESGSFGNITLPGGDWVTMLDVANTGASLQRLSTVKVMEASDGPAIEVTDFTFNPDTTVLNLSFTSEVGGQYTLEYTIGFEAAGSPPSASKWTIVPSHSTITGAAGTTAIEPLNISTLVIPNGLLPDAHKCFFRIRKVPGNIAEAALAKYNSGNTLTPWEALAMAVHRKIDVVMVGDSNQLHSGNGWDSGWNKAFEARWKMHSSPLYFTQRTSVGYTTSGQGMGPEADPVPTPFTSYFIKCAQLSDGATDTNGSGIIIQPQSKLDVNSALRWECLYGTTNTGSGSFRPGYRRESTPFSPGAWGTTVSTNTGTVGAARATYDLAAGTRNYAVKIGGQIQGSTTPTGTATGPVTMFCERVMDTLATTGFSATTWMAESGKSLEDMLGYAQAYNPSAAIAFFTEIRRVQAAATGKPVFVFIINSGVNDRNNTGPSKGPGKIADGDSPEAYVDNLEGLLDFVETIWRSQGWDLTELHWIVIPSHRISDPDDAELVSYRQATRSAISKRQQCALVDIGQIMTASEALANSWYQADGSDPIHMTAAGHQAIAERILINNGL